MKSVADTRNIPGRNQNRSSISKDRFKFENFLERTIDDEIQIST